MPNHSLKSPYQWEEDDEFNLLTALLEIATESVESYNPSINLFDRVTKAINKSIGYQEILNKVHDLQKRYHSHNNAGKKDRIFIISNEIWGSHPKLGGSDEGGCKSVTEKREMEKEANVQGMHLVMKGKHEEPEEHCRKQVKLDEQEQSYRKWVKKKKPEKECLQCAAKSTPQWRIGPMGPTTLCNACGIQYYKHHLKTSKTSLRKHSKPAKKIWS